MRLTYRIIVVVAAMAATGLQARAQDLGETLQGVGVAYAEAYVQPLVNAFGADMNSGLFHSAKIGGGMLPLVDLYVGVKVFGALVPADDKTLDLSYTTPQVFTGPDGIDYTLDVTYQINDAPTVFGDSDPGVAVASVSEVVAPGPDGQFGTADDIEINEQAQLNLAPGVIETSIVPLIVPHIQIGSAFGTDVMIRYLPRIKSADLGSVGLFGFGVRHSISQYVPLLPIDLAAQVSFQNLGLMDSDDNEVVDASMWALSVMAGKSFFIASVYGGLQLESANVDVSYTFVDPEGILPNEEIDFSMTGSNRIRALAGVAVHLSPLTLNVDYSVGSVSVISAGLGLSF